jgi:hypothetical protein
MINSNETDSTAHHAISKLAALLITVADNIKNGGRGEILSLLQYKEEICGVD